MQEKEFEPMSKELEENELESVVGGYKSDSYFINGNWGTKINSTDIDWITAINR